MADLFRNLTSPFLVRNNGELDFIVQAIETALQQLDIDSREMRLELFINSANGKWLNEWGSWFGVSRFLDETDEQYRVRIIASLSSSKVTINALREIVRNFIQDPTATVIVYEPFTNLRRFNVSQYSDQDHYQNAEYYRIGVIDIQSSAERTDRFTTLINDSKPAGVKVFFTKLLDVNYEGAQILINTFDSTNETTIEKNIKTEPHTDVATFSSGLASKPRSGNKIVDESIEVTYEPSSSPYTLSPSAYGGDRISMAYKEILAGSSMPISLVADVPINEIIYVTDIGLPMVVETMPV